MLQGVHLISCVVQSLLNMCIPCIDVIFTFTSTTSTRSLHLKKPCKKLHSACSKHAMFIFCLKCKTYFSLYCFHLCLHVIPCYSLSYHHVKISGSLFIILLTLILSHILIVIILGKSILLSLNVNVILFQFISNMSHK